MPSLADLGRPLSSPAAPIIVSIVFPPVDCGGSLSQSLVSCLPVLSGTEYWQAFAFMDGFGFGFGFVLSQAAVFKNSSGLGYWLMNCTFL
jgi:hypothetical protein